MTDRQYWLDLFTWKTWQEFLNSGGDVSGFRESRRNLVQAVKPGDVFLCYLTGVSRFIGALEVTSDGYRDEKQISSEESFPWRVRVRPLVTLTPETAVPVHDVMPGLSWWTDAQVGGAWTGHFRASPARWPPEDGGLVLEALELAAASPSVREVDPRKLRRKAKVYGRRKVTVPTKEPEPSPEPVSPEPVAPGAVEEDETRAHTEIQYTLLRLGSEMGLGVWVARNDKGKEYDGHRLADVPNLRDDLPRQFDEDTSRTVRLIDVLWLRRDTIVAAFEIEKSTTIYSGLLRMADLVALQPNLNIPLYIVAPDSRREKVREEINRPVFSRALEPPLSSTCRYIAFGRLRAEVRRLGDLVKHLKPDFIHTLSEDCSL